MCKACGDEFTRFYAPGYCSETCFCRYKGQKALRHIKQDHTLCATCFKPLKTIEEPPEFKSVTVGPVDHDQIPDVTSDVLIGYQYPTKHMAVAIDERHHGDAGDTPSPRERIEYTRWACECGAVDSRHRYRVIEENDPHQIAINFAVCLNRLARQDAIAGSFDMERFSEVFSDHWLFYDGVGVAGHDYRDWASIAGHALFGT